ncbi:MAG: AbrB family transcriptional regulator [Alphaproteobacteria bacterium]|nr:AbrB family transcriptional regulator [Alphaproteobacteria bacterium]
MSRPPRSFGPTDWRALAAALVIGTAGGFAFDQATLPLAWLLGAMVFVTVAAAAGARIAIPFWLRAACNVVLGVLLGSGFSPDILDRLGGWAVTIIALMVYVLAIGLALAVVFRRVFGYDPVTAYFAAMPGGVVEMTMIGTEMGGDGRTIALSHGARVVIVALSIPLGYRFLGGYVPQGLEGLGGGLLDLGALELVLLAASGVLGWPVAARLRIPAPQMTGPLLLSAIAHATGILEAKPPALISAAAQVGVGAAIGCTFAGVRLAMIVRTLSIASVSVGMVILLTLAVAVLLSGLTAIPTSAIFLAYAPGGVTEMCLVALALGLDVVFVATHHVVRFSFVVVIAPVSARFLRRQGRSGHTVDPD